MEKSFPNSNCKLLFFLFFFAIKVLHSFELFLPPPPLPTLGAHKRGKGQAVPVDPDDPVVWSLDGPVWNDGVPPLCIVQSKLSFFESTHGDFDPELNPVSMVHAAEKKTMTSND